MKILKFKFFGTIALLVLFVSSCQDLTEINVNPNGVDPAVAHPNLIMPTVITNTAKNYLNMGFGNIAGVMQHTQKDAWSSGHNDYAWDEDSWGGYYGILRDNKFMYEKAVEGDLKFHQGVALVMKSFVFGFVTDLWGDAPFTDALKSAEGQEFLKPAFDGQQTIYDGIFADLAEANTLFSGTDFAEVNADADVLYGGDAKMWQKFANSLALRYYMRVSDKMPNVAKDGVERVSKLPLLTAADEDAAIPYIGTSGDNSWPSNIPFANNSAYLRYNICSVLSEKLLELGDDRIEVFANKVETPIVITDDHAAEGEDVTVDGVRYITNAAFTTRQYKLKVAGENPSAADLDAGFTFVDTNPSGYVGLPPSMGSEPNWYNINPAPVQGGNNIHVSKLNSMYAETSGALLKMRLISAAEVHFILAEAALKGWAVAGDANAHYDAGVQASFDTWGVDIGDYLTGPAAFDGTLDKVMEQKWIASWTAATEAWFDWRRTGLPAIQAGARARRENPPLRLYYGHDERDLNAENYIQAIARLQPTADNNEDDNDSAWSKMWLLQ